MGALGRSVWLSLLGEFGMDRVRGVWRFEVLGKKC
jgi:hypothetical protein